MMIRWYHRSGQAFLAFLLAVLFVLQPLGSVYAAMSEAPDTAFGRVVDVRKTELAPGAEYTWYDMEIDRGLEKMHLSNLIRIHPSWTCVQEQKVDTYMEWKACRKWPSIQMLRATV